MDCFSLLLRSNHLFHALALFLSIAIISSVITTIIQIGAPTQVEIIEAAKYLVAFVKGGIRLLIRVAYKLLKLIRHIFPNIP